MVHIKDKPVLYVDMDSTVFDYLFEYGKRHFEATGERVYLTPVDLRDSRYHINQKFGISDRFKYRYLDERFFEEMPFYDNAKEVLNKLKDKYHIIFTTHIVTKEAFKGKINRLEREFSWFNFEDNLIAIKDKYLLRPSIIIDDNPYVITNCVKRSFDVIIYNQVWNEEICEGVTRVYSWLDIERMLNSKSF